MKNIIRICISLVLLLSACATSKITTIWKAKNIDPQNYRSILVLALIRDGDSAIQEKMENHLVGDLNELGYNALSSKKEYGPRLFDKMEEDSVIGKLQKGATDAVLTIVLLDKKKEQKYVPVNVYQSPFGYNYYQLGPYKIAAYRRINEPGYYVNGTMYYWESNLYDMSAQKLLYSVQTQSFDLSNLELMGHEFGRIIVKHLLAHKVLERK